MLQLCQPLLDCFVRGGVIEAAGQVVQLVRKLVPCLLREFDLARRDNPIVAKLLPKRIVGQFIDGKSKDSKSFRQQILTEEVIEGGD